MSVINDALPAASGPRDFDPLFVYFCPFQLQFGWLFSATYFKYHPIHCLSHGWWKQNSPRKHQNKLITLYGEIIYTIVISDLW